MLRALVLAGCCTLAFLQYRTTNAMVLPMRAPSSAQACLPRNGGPELTGRRGASMMAGGDRRKFDRIQRCRPPWRRWRSRSTSVLLGDDAHVVKGSGPTRSSASVVVEAEGILAEEDVGADGIVKQKTGRRKRRSNSMSEMGFDMSVWGSLRNFWTHVGQTYRSSREKPDVQSGDWRYMGSLVMSQGWLILSSVVTLILAAGCSVAVPHYSSRALNAAAFAKDKLEFATCLRGMICFNLMGSLFTGLRGACFWLAGTHVVAKVRFDLLASLLNQDIAFHDANETGALTSRLASDTAKISNVVSFHVNILCRQIIQAAGGLGYLFLLNRRLASIALVGLVTVGGITTAYGRFSRRISAKVQSALAEAGSVAEQSLSLVRVVRAHANEAHERRRYGRKIGESVQLQETQGIAYGLARVVIGWSQALLLGGVLTMGANMVFSGQMSGPALTTFVFYTNFVIDASFDVGDQWAKIQEALGAGQKVFELLDRKPAGTKEKPQQAQRHQHQNSPIEAEPALADTSKGVRFDDQTGTLVKTDEGIGARKSGGVDSSGGDAGAVSTYLKNTPASRSEEEGMVEFRSIRFGYPTRPGVLVLDGLSLVVGQGEKVAVVGASGGGKSTILRLLCRFYDPEEGVISLGGRDISTYDAEEISNRVSWVTQEPQLFPITVRENIAYGLEDGSYSMADIEKAATAANIHSFVRGLPDGYETLVGEGGASLSGGQKQRVAIARALIRDPEVLLLDEPTSALDAESERLVQEALDTAGEGRSVILIAHRLATIQRADRVLVMQNGRVVESGKHDDLLALGGVYANLYKEGEKVATL